MAVGMVAEAGSWFSHNVSIVKKQGVNRKCSLNIKPQGPLQVTHLPREWYYPWWTQSFYITLTIKNKAYFTVPPIFHKSPSNTTVGVHISYSIPTVWLDLLRQNCKNAVRVGILSQEGCVNLSPLNMVVVGRLL